VAADTANFIVEDFRLEGLTFRIGAPGAAQGAAFEKDHRSYAGAIMSGESLDIEDYGHQEEHYQIIFVWSMFDSVRKYYENWSRPEKR
jgi:hypothetical protein